MFFTSQSPLSFKLSVIMPGKKTAKKRSQKSADRSTPNRETSPPATRRGKRLRTDDEGDHQGTEKRLQTSEEQSTSKTVTSADIPNIVTTVLKSLSANTNPQNSGGTPNASTTTGAATIVASGNSNPTPTRAANDDSPRPLTTEDVSAIVGAIVGNHSRQTNPTARDLPRPLFSDLGKHLSVNIQHVFSICLYVCCYKPNMTMHGRHAFVTVLLYIPTCYWHTPCTLHDSQTLNPPTPIANKCYRIFFSPIPLFHPLPLHATIDHIEEFGTSQAPSDTTKSPEKASSSSISHPPPY